VHLELLLLIVRHEQEGWRPLQHAVALLEQPTAGGEVDVVHLLERALEQLELLLLLRGSVEIGDARAVGGLCLLGLLLLDDLVERLQHELVQVLHLLAIDARRALYHHRCLDKVECPAVELIERDSDGLELAEVLLELARDVDRPVLSQVADRFEQVGEASVRARCSGGRHVHPSSGLAPEGRKYQKTPV